MRRLFYCIEDKIYLDKEALLNMAQEHLLRVDDLSTILGINAVFPGTNLIEA